MIKLYDIVKAINPINDLIRIGTIGTILIIYDSDPIKYEVEFVDDNMNSIAVLTVNESDLKKVYTCK